MAQKETILGNYTSFPRFPLDCESMEYIQANTQLLSVIARLSGCDKLILSGCDITSGSTRAEGYVYIRTGNDLVGEVVYFKGGTGTRCKIVPTNFDVTANGEKFRNAYTKRILESSSSPSDMAWGDFAKLSDISNAALKTAVNGKAAASHTHAISNVTGLQSALDSKAASNHTHNYSAPGHTHDDRYYTESEINTKLSGKSDINHTHNYSAPGHNHDTVYYKKTEVYTKSEVDDKIKVTEASNMFDGDNIHCYKQGKFVFCSINSLSGYRGRKTDGEDNRDNYIGYLDIPSGFRPKMIVFGVGIGTTNNELSVKNHMQFWIKPDGRIFWRYFVEKIPETGDYANGYDTISASICYITD